jgi:hypothetical protein
MLRLRTTGKGGSERRRHSRRRTGMDEQQIDARERACLRLQGQELDWKPPDQGEGHRPAAPRGTKLYTNSTLPRMFERRCVRAEVHKSSARNAVGVPATIDTVKERRPSRRWAGANVRGTFAPAPWIPAGEIQHFKRFIGPNENPLDQEDGHRPAAHRRIQSSTEPSRPNSGAGNDMVRRRRRE